MTTPPLNVNGIRAVSVRLVQPWTGVWFADVDLDPDDASEALSGGAELAIVDTTLSGTIDPRYTGRFVGILRARVVGGAGGWDKAVGPQFWANDAGVSNTDVYQATASAVGETVAVQTSATLGRTFSRTAGPASRVLEGSDWYVDLAGVTQVGARATTSPDASVIIQGYDAGQALLQLTSDPVVIVPGTTFTDSRFDGTLLARDVEQTFTADGTRTTVWTGASAAPRLVTALKNVARELSGAKWLKIVEYRVVNQSGARLNLQAVDPEAGYPDAMPVEVWPGAAGLSSKPAPSQGVLVGFVNGDSTRAIVVGFDANLPLEATIDAQNKVHIAPSGQNPAPIARLGDATVTFFPPSIPVAGTISPIPPATTPPPMLFAGVLTITSPCPGIIQAGSSKADCGT